MQITENQQGANNNNNADEMEGIRVSSGHGGRRGGGGGDDMNVLHVRTFLVPFSPEVYEQLSDGEFQSAGTSLQRSQGHHASPVNDRNKNMGPQSDPPINRSDSNETNGSPSVDDDNDDDIEDGTNGTDESHDPSDSPGGIGTTLTHRRRNAQSSTNTEQGIPLISRGQPDDNDEPALESSIIRSGDPDDDHITDPLAVVPISSVVTHSSGRGMAPVRGPSREIGGPEWPCPQCTLLNPSHHVMCQACDFTRRE